MKILATLAVTMVIYDGPDSIFRLVFGTLPVVRPLFAFHDPLHQEFKDEMHEFHFRSGLDRYIWISGMICALRYNHFAALKKTGYPSFPGPRRSCLAACGGSMFFNWTNTPTTRFIHSRVKLTNKRETQRIRCAFCPTC